MFAFLWFDDSKAPLEEKVSRGASHLTEKFGEPPNMVSVRGDSEGQLMVAGLPVVEQSFVLPHHFQFEWLNVPPKARENVDGTN